MVAAAAVTATMIEEVTIEGVMIAIAEGDLPEVTIVTEIGIKVAMTEAITVAAAATITVEVAAALLKEAITVVAAATNTVAAVAV